MSVKNLYPSKSNYLKPVDLNGRSIKATIAKISYNEFQGEQKINLGFGGTDKTFTLNKTNADILASAFGDDEREWVGKKIVLSPTKGKNMQGHIIDTIKVSADLPVAEGFEPAPHAKTSVSEINPPPFDDDDLSGISF